MVLVCQVCLCACVCARICAEEASRMSLNFTISFRRLKNRNFDVIQFNVDKLIFENFLFFFLDGIDIWS